MNLPGDDTPATATNRARLVTWALLAEAGVLAFAYVVALAVGVRFWDTLHFSIGGLGWGLAACLPMLAAAIVLVKLPWRAVETIRRDFDAICALFRGCSVTQLVLISLMAGLSEEVLFRGVMQAYAAEQMSPWAGVAVASVVFGLLHALSPIYVVFATAMGAYLGAIYLWTNDLLIVIAAHAAYDAAALIYGVHLQRAPDAPEDN